MERSRDGVQEGPGEKRRSDDAPASGVGGIGATPCRAKALGWTGSALDHGGVAGFKGLRPCRRPRHEGAGAAADLEETATSNPSLLSSSEGWLVVGRRGLRGRETGLAGRVAQERIW